MKETQTRFRDGKGEMRRLLVHASNRTYSKDRGDFVFLWSLDWTDTMCLVSAHDDYTHISRFI